MYILRGDSIVFVRIHRNFVYILFILCSFLLIVSGCASDHSTISSARATPSPTFQGIVAPICNSSCAVGNVAGTRAFIDTWTNIHLFQSFDYHIHNAAAIAKYYDFIWGADPRNVAAYRAGNPNITLSYYLSFFRDSGVFGNTDTHQSLNFWRTQHPDWILYRCDRVTPAYEDNQNNVVPFDFTNPDLVQWQVQIYALPASQHGYDAIAADNLNMENLIGACGSYKNGKWVQRYTGATNDSQWRADVVTWVTRMQEALHALSHPLVLIPNLGIGVVPLNDVALQQVVSHVDGILDEGGFTDYGQGYMTDRDWLQMVQFIENVQTQHKAYYNVNEFPSSLSRSDIEWALASYLMCKQHTASLFISLIQQYGADLHDTLYLPQIGEPRVDMYQGQNVYWRDYTHGISIVNPSSSASYTIKLTGQYTDLDGNPVGQTITLPPHSGEVLLF